MVLRPVRSYCCDDFGSRMRGPASINSVYNEEQGECETFDIAIFRSPGKVKP